MDSHNLPKFALTLAALALTATTAQQHTLGTLHFPNAVAQGQAKLLGPFPSQQHLQLALSLPLRNEPERDSLLQKI